MSDLLKQQYGYWLTLFLLALVFGTIYAAQLLGFSWLNDTLLEPATTRTLHISLMLYGPIMIILSLLPFALFDRDGLGLGGAVVHLRRYFLLWNYFLFAMALSLLFGLQRHLPFYDFPYELNFLLALAGVFYIVAIFITIKQYGKEPVWVRVSKSILFAAPLLLLLLMNPEYGQVEQTVSGPHGDNTLGMSFALIPIYYLLIKLYVPDSFAGRGHLLWIIPLVGYILSVLHRIFLGELSYLQEWIFQWLTFLYAPLLYLWMKDGLITYRSHPYLVMSIIAFLFVMVEGNILFIPEIRWIFHRNDLIVAHAHLAIGVGIMFMALSVLDYFHKLPGWFARFWFIVIGVIFVVLSVAGFIEAGLLSMPVEWMWWIRMMAGLVAVVGIVYWLLRHIVIPEVSPLMLYHLNGMASDGLGGLILILFGPQLFGFIGFDFAMEYYIVFGFMAFVGFMHGVGIYTKRAHMAEYTAYARLITGTMFYILYCGGYIDELGILVAVYDITYAMFYFLGIKR